MKKYDVIVIGGGPAGGGVAPLLAEAGLKVAMFESRAFGGVCPLRGCNPKKVLRAGAEAVESSRLMRGKGVPCPLHIDWRKLQQFKNTFIDGLPERVEEHHRSKGVDTIHARASFTGPDTVEADGKTYTADHFCVCTGMTPRPLDIPGAEHLTTSTDFLHMEHAPERIAFIGGGFVAMELAHIATRCSMETTVAVRGERILRHYDLELAEMLVESSRQSGIDLRLNAPPKGLEKHDGSLVLFLGSGATVEADMVVNCAGRIPALDDLGLDKAGVKFDKYGITVDSQMRSVSNPKVFGLGDASSTPFALTPTASHEADVAAANIIEPGSRETDFSGVPQVVFTLPPLAMAGMSPEEGEAKGYTVKKYDLADSFSWKRLGEKFGCSKIVIDEETDRILGAQILGHDADEMINTLALAIHEGIPRTTLKTMIWAYPTSGYYLRYML